MCESENLIMAVEKYPCIWDIHNEDYHNRDIKDLAWEKICKELYNNWDEYTDKTNKCAELKRKWTNIRDYYRKEIQKPKRIPTGSAAKISKKYIYSDLLCFLTPVFANRKSEGNYSNEDTDCTQPQLQTNEEEESIEHDVTEVPIQTSPVVKAQKKKNDVPSQILDMLQKRQKATATPIADEDDDTKFLLSFRSYMKKMNPNQKIDFKLGMLQLVKKINMGNYPSSQSSNYSSVISTTPQSIYSSYTPVHQSSPSCFNISIPPTLPQNMYVPQNHPPANSFSHQPNVSSASTSKPKLIIHSITNIPPPHSSTQQNPIQEYPQNSEPNNNIIQTELTEDSQAAQFITLQYQNTQENDIHNYLKFK